MKGNGFGQTNLAQRLEKGLPKTALETNPETRLPPAAL
jgi:hypothetical protein